MTEIHTFDTVEEGLNAELAMLAGVADGSPSRFMIWQSATPALVLPHRFSTRSQYVAASEASAARGWPVATRRTGGGITPQGPGVLNIALSYAVPPKDARSVAKGYAALCDPLIEALAEMGFAATTGAVRGSFCDGDYNLEIAGKKLVGTAQRWRGGAVLCHALVLVDIDLETAVTAAQHLSDSLDMGDTYEVRVHTRLTDLAQGKNPGQTFARHLASILENHSYSII